jgi:hypothetical protein
MRRKKAEPSQWKAVMSDEHLTEEEKYEQLVKQVEILEAKTREKQNNMRH